MATAPSTALDPPTAATARGKLRVALVDEELPYPPTSGKRIRTLGLIERLARRHQLTYVCHRNPDEDEAYRAVEHFAALGIRTLVVDRPVPPKSGPRFYARLAANLLSPLPYSVTSHTSRALVEALRDLAASEPIDLWHCEWTPYAQALRGVAGRRVVMAHNVESVIWQRYHETEANPLKRWYIGRQWRKFVRFEREALSRADLTIAVSDLDAGRFRDDLGVRRVAVVDNGVDTDYFRPLGGPREPATLLFLGSLEWRPNLDGVAQMLDHVFPAVRAQAPEAKLLLVGRNPPAWLRRVVRPGVELHADVPDVRPFLARAGMLVVPLRIGGGSRLKILEALASGTPVVSTRIGAEGLHLDGRHLSMCEDVAGMPAAVLDAIRDPQSAAHRTEAGRRRVLERYDWEVLADRLEQLWLRCVHDAPPVLARAGGHA
jgi:glycosyltransferase involved in cell wall biosynthesis